MATAPGNDSATVFKRNISLNVENYVLDFQMLRVLGKIDGARSVAAVAATLNADITDVKATCARLLKQRLIMPARSRRPSLPPSSRRAPPARPGPPSAATPSDPPPSDLQPIETEFSRESLPGGRRSGTDQPWNGPDTSTPAGDPQPQANPRQAILPPEGRVTASPPQNAWIWPGNGSKPSAPAPGAGSPPTATAFDGLWGRNGRGADTVDPTSPSDIFSIARSVDPDPSEPRTGAFAAALGSKMKPADAAPFLTAAEASDPKPDARPALAPGKAEAIEHFEQGLVFLQRSALDEALRQFEIALQLDPENRLCRANIQRIRGKLSHGS